MNRITLPIIIFIIIFLGLVFINSFGNNQIQANSNLNYQNGIIIKQCEDRVATANQIYLPLVTSPRKIIRSAPLPKNIISEIDFKDNNNNNLANATNLNNTDSDFELRVCGASNPDSEQPMIGYDYYSFDVRYTSDVTVSIKQADRDNILQLAIITEGSSIPKAGPITTPAENSNEKSEVYLTSLPGTYFIQIAWVIDEEEEDIENYAYELDFFATLDESVTPEPTHTPTPQTQVPTPETQTPTPTPIVPSPTPTLFPIIPNEMPLIFEDSLQGIDPEGDFHKWYLFGLKEGELLRTSDGLKIKHDGEVRKAIGLSARIDFSDSDGSSMDSIPINDTYILVEAEMRIDRIQSGYVYLALNSENPSNQTIIQCTLGGQVIIGGELKPKQECVFNAFSDDQDPFRRARFAELDQWYKMKIFIDPVNNLIYFNLDDMWVWSTPLVIGNEDLYGLDVAFWKFAEDEDEELIGYIRNVKLYAQSVE